MSWLEWTDSTFRGLDLTSLKVDEAYLNITNGNNQEYFLYTLSEECSRCPLRKVQRIAERNETIITLNTAHSLELRLFSNDYGAFVHPSENNDHLIWSSQPTLGEFGVYDLIIGPTTVFNVAKQPVPTFPSFFIVMFIAFCVYWIFKCAKHFNPSLPIGIPPAKETHAMSLTSETKERMRSLDIFRGIATVFMIVGNNGGGRYWWIQHAAWNGLHLADVVFPCFLFIMGVCITLGINSQIAHQVPTSAIVHRVIKRSIVLFIMGICYNTIFGASFESIRIMGVIQRFGIAYLVVSLIYLAFVRGPIEKQAKETEQLFGDIRAIWKQWLIMIVFIVIYLAVIFGVSAPGCERGYFGPGGTHDIMAHANCTGGIVGFIDRSVLGERHMSQWEKVRAVYDTLAFDSEGIFGCLLTCVQVFLGVQCGVTFLTYSKERERLNRWMTWGVGLTFVTCLLTNFSLDDGLIPINKSLWSLSFVTATTALAFLLLSLIYYLVDVKNYGDDCWTIFLYPGMNPILLYIGHAIFNSMWPFHWSAANMNTHFLLMLENTYTVIVWILISHFMYHKKIIYNV